VLSVQLLARILTIYISELVSGKLPLEISYPSRLVHFWTRVLRPQRTWKNIPNWHWTSMNHWVYRMVDERRWFCRHRISESILRVVCHGCHVWYADTVALFFSFFFDQDTVALCSHHWHAAWPQTPHSRSWCQVSHHVRFHHKGEYDTCTISDWTFAHNVIDWNCPGSTTRYCTNCTQGYTASVIPQLSSDRHRVPECWQKGLSPILIPLVLLIFPQGRV